MRLDWVWVGLENNLASSDLIWRKPPHWGRDSEEPYLESSSADLTGVMALSLLFLIAKSQVNSVPVYYFDDKACRMLSDLDLWKN